MDVTGVLFSHHKLMSCHSLAWNRLPDDSVAGGGTITFRAATADPRPGSSQRHCRLPGQNHRWPAERGLDIRPSPAASGRSPGSCCPFYRPAYLQARQPAATKAPRGAAGICPARPETWQPQSISNPPPAGTDSKLPGETPV